MSRVYKWKIARFEATTSHSSKESRRQFASLISLFTILPPMCANVPLTELLETFFSLHHIPAELLEVFCKWSPIFESERQLLRIFANFGSERELFDSEREFFTIFARQARTARITCANCANLSRESRQLLATTARTFRDYGHLREVLHKYVYHFCCFNCIQIFIGLEEKQ